MRAIAVALPIAAALLAGCGPTTSGGPADPRLLALIPANTRVLAGLRIDELKKTALYQQVMPLVGSVERQGFNPQRDVDELLVASDGEQTVAIARGRFQRDELAGLEQSVYKGVTLYGNERGAVGLIDSSVAIAGTTPAVHAAIDQQKSGGQAVPALLVKARGLATPNQIWMVSQGSAGFLRVPRFDSAEMVQKMLNSLSSVTFVADFREGIYARAEAQSATPADAQFIGNTLRGLIGLGRLSVPRGEAELAKAFDGIAVEQTDRSLALDARIPRAVADQAMGRLRSFSDQESRRQTPTPRPR
jgi:hypothetical protein